MSGSADAGGSPPGAAAAAAVPPQLPGPAWTPELALSLRQQAAEYEAAHRASVLSPGDPLDRTDMPVSANRWYSLQLHKASCQTLWPMVAAIRGAAHRAPILEKHMASMFQKKHLIKELAEHAWVHTPWEHLGGDGWNDWYPKFRMNYVFKVVIEGLTPYLAKKNVREIAYCIGISTDAEKARRAPRRN